MLIIIYQAARCNTSTNYLSVHRSTTMARVTILVQLLLLFVVLKRSDGLQNAVSGMENKECQPFKHEIKVSQCYFIGLQYSIITYITIQWELLLYCLCVVTVIQLYIVKCYEWLLYCSCSVTPALLYVAQCYVNCYYILGVSSLENSYMYPNVIWIAKTYYFLAYFSM
jgi:hypothetical protein